MINVAGGSIDDFAPLLLGYLRRCIQHPSPDPNLYFQCIRHLINFIIHADAFPIEREHEWSSIPVGPLGRTLYEFNFEVELVSTVIFYCENDETHEDTPYAIDECMKLIYRMTSMSSPAAWAGQLLKRGLLRALVLITPQCESHGWWIEYWVRFCLQGQLPLALVYYHTLGAFDESLKKVRGLMSGDRFKRSPLYQEWQQFLTYTMQERLDARDEFAAKTVAYKACDNLRCGSAGRCSECQGFYYGSRECQKVDWKAGHRGVCDPYRSLLLTKIAPEPYLGCTERSFLRHLIHHKYVKERRSIWVQQVNIFAAQPGKSSVSPVLFTLFDFCQSPPLIKVYDADVEDCGLDEFEDTTSPEWEDLIERARRSEGRMQLHGSVFWRVHRVCASSLCGQRVRRDMSVCVIWRVECARDRSRKLGFWGRLMLFWGVWAGDPLERNVIFEIPTLSAGRSAIYFC
ncbi:hypothetical protein FB45DRAFT_445701 [Roridomyces roridus]|uniref:MYND-type domain-containing protein n=1 Tax=Roridomyces roridus TaxID=1738132 RepID=A0AAD7C161_9AGAR|nr:hypothetical protein FB45DRAFT_445701 [Roridomyces roridus]